MFEKMGLQGKMEVEVDIKSCGDVFHELWSTKPHHVSNIVPDKIHGCDVHEGDYGHVGSIILWTYTHGNLIKYLIKFLI